MKIKNFFLSILLACIGWSSSFAQVGIGTTTPAPSAILDLTATNKGLLPPRMTTNQRQEITSPATGLFIFNLTVNCMQWFNGTGWFDACDGTITGLPIASGACAGEPQFFTFNGKIYRPIENRGKCWLDRNLGASRVAISSIDPESYGSLYQWGRAADGHQLVNRFFPDGVTTSTNTAVNATVNTDTPPHSNFIIVNTGNFDWRSPQNVNLWQGISGTNNPCPSGYRLPTATELDNERLSWYPYNNAAGALASLLKLPMAGLRSFNGVLQYVGTFGLGQYWSSTVSSTFSGTYSIGLGFDSVDAGVGAYRRAIGYSVRCIKD